MINRVETPSDRIRNHNSQNGVIQPLLTGKLIIIASSGPAALVNISYIGAFSFLCFAASI